MESKETVNLPTGVEVIAEIGQGLVIAWVETDLIREQDKNAQVMESEAFRQLTENISKRGALESLPFCALTDKVEMVSGHHRLRAAKEAKLKRIPVILDISGLTRSQIAAKQLAHNAINGFSDKNIIKEIVKMITDVDDMIESFIGNDVIKQANQELEKYISPILDFDYKQIQFMFLPHQVAELEKLVSRLKDKKDYIGVAHIDQYEQLLETLKKYQSFSNVKNIGAAIYSMIEQANQTMNDAEFNGDWLPLSRILGSAAIPKQSFEIIKEALDKMKEQGVFTKNDGWKGLQKLAEDYLK